MASGIYFSPNLPTTVSSTGTSSLAWPSGHKAGDVAFLVCESAGEAVSTPSGWNSVGGHIEATNPSALHVFWKRATSSAEANVSIPDSGNHTQSMMRVVRGLPTTGTPFVSITFNDETSLTTTHSLPTVDITSNNAAGLTTPFLFCAAFDDDRDVVGVTLSAGASSTWITDFTSTIDGNDGGISCGLAYSVGSNSVGGSVTSSLNAESTTAIIILPTTKNVTVVNPQGTGKGSPQLRVGDNPTPSSMPVSSGTAGLTPAYPNNGGDVGDLALLIVESQESSVTLSDAQGYTTLLATTGGGTQPTYLTVFSKVLSADSGSATAPTIADPGDHLLAQHVILKNVVDMGDPQTAQQNIAGTNATLNWPTVTPSSTEACMVLYIGTCSQDSSGATNGYSNTGSVSTSGGVGFTTVGYGGTTNGNGGNLYVAFQYWDESAGTVTHSQTSAATNQSYTMMALPVYGVEAEFFVVGSDTVAGTDSVVSQTVTTADGSDSAVASDTTVSLVTIEDKTGSDAAVATDATVSIVVPDLSSSDAAAATDSVVGLNQAHVASDSAVAADATVSLQQDHTAADGVAAADSVDPVIALVAESDVVAATDTADASNTALGDDVAATTDSVVDLQQDHTASDSVAAVDDAWLSQKEMFEPDAVSAVDLVDPVLAQAEAEDAVAAVEDANASNALDAPGDSVTGIDSPVQVDLIAEDQGTAVDSAFVSDQVLATQGDSVAAVDSVSLVDVSIDASDSTTGTDSTTLLNQEELGSDTATGTDAVVSLVIEVSDVASGTDGAVLAVILPTQSDTVTAEDSPILSAEDSLTAAETAFLFIEGQGLQAPRAHHVESDRRQQRVGSSRSEQLVKIKAERRMTVIGTTPHVTL